MKKHLGTILTVIIVLTGVILGFVFGAPSLTNLQKETLLILAIICGASALYCFLVGEITRNNSQMDKLWSILPIIYTWVVAIKGGFNFRLVIIAVLATLWGVRLTVNFAKKGAYSWKFWSGEEDYRWVVLRRNKILGKKFIWAIFDLLFISIYQNALVLAICLPAVVCMESGNGFNWIDIVATVLVFGFIVLETIADKQQMDFYTERNRLLKEGKKLEELPEPYNKGFNTFGLWNRSRHPNYFSEQSIWICLYFFAIAAGATTYYVFNWSMTGCLLLIFLFLGSSQFSESVSKSKYPEYEVYLSKVSKYIPWKKYRK